MSLNYKIKQFLAMQHKLDVAIEQQNIIIERLNKTMSAINNLQDALNRLASATDSAVTVLNTPHPSETSIQAAADLVNAQSVRLETAAGVTTTAAGVTTAAPVQ